MRTARIAITGALNVGLVCLAVTGAGAAAQGERWPACEAAGLASLTPPEPPASAPPIQPYDPLRGFDRDVALGIAHLRPAEHVGDWTGKITLPLFERPQAPPDAWLANGWVLSSDASPFPLGSSGLTETGYEIPSFIVFETRADGWVRLRFARGRDGVAWTHGCYFDQPAGRLAVERWETRFLSNEISPLYFRARVPHALRRQPSEAAPRVRWIPADSDSYALRPFEVRGDWMRVELSEPSDYCVLPDSPPVIKVSGWIRWRGESGEPWVWYYTRGC